MTEILTLAALACGAVAVLGLTILFAASRHDADASDDGDGATDQCSGDCQDDFHTAMQRAIAREQRMKQ